MKRSIFDLQAPVAPRAARGRNASTLAYKNPIEGLDDRVEFVERTHTYRVDGVKVNRSVTALLKSCFVHDEFNPVLVIQKNLASWRSKPTSKYHNLVRDKSDGEATAAVRQEWDRTRDLGTLLHKVIELKLNGVLDDNGIPDDVAPDMAQFEAFLSEYADLTPVRTELCMFWESSDGNVSVAGQTDAIMKDSEGRHIVIDWKRVDQDLSADAHDWGRPGVGVMKGRSGNHLMQYSLQAHAYAEMFKKHTEIEIEACFLLQLHPSQSSFKLFRCPDLRKEALEMLNKA